MHESLLFRKEIPGLASLEADRFKLALVVGAIH